MSDRFQGPGSLTFKKITFFFLIQKRRIMRVYRIKTAHTGSHGFTRSLLFFLESSVCALCPVCCVYAADQLGHRTFKVGESEGTVGVKLIGPFYCAVCPVH